MKTSQVLVFILTIFASTNILAKSYKVESLSYERVSENKGKLVINFDKDYLETPELITKNNLIQLSLPEAIVWPKIEKRQSIEGELDSTLMAYQYNKGLSRVRILLPKNEQRNLTKSNVLFKNKKVVIEFPIQSRINFSRNVSKRVSARKAPIKTKRNEVVSDKLDESYLAKLMSSDESENKFKRDFQNHIEEKKKILNPEAIKKKLETVAQLPKKEVDQVTSSSSAVQKKSQTNLDLTGYIVKFVFFLAIILGFFYLAVTLFKKGIFNKNKLNFLKNTEMVSVLNTTYIGPKRSLLMVKAHNQVFLIGNSEQGLNYISEVEDLSGILKQGEKEISGTNFDTSVDKVDLNTIDTKVKIKKDLTQSSNGKIADFLEKSNPVKKNNGFADKLRKKAKELKPMNY